MVTSPMAGFLLGLLIMGAAVGADQQHERAGGVARTHLRGRAGSMPSSARRRSSARPTWASRTAPTTRRRPWASSRWRCSARRLGHAGHLPAWLAFLHPDGGKDGHRQLDHRHLRAGDGGRHRGRRLAHHQDARPQDGEAASDQRLRRGNQFGDDPRHWPRTSACRCRPPTASPPRSWAWASPRIRTRSSWTVIERIVWAWILTIPAAGGIAYGLVRLFRKRYGPGLTASRAGRRRRTASAPDGRPCRRSPGSGGRLRPASGSRRDGSRTAAGRARQSSSPMAR